MDPDEEVQVNPQREVSALLIDRLTKGRAVVTGERVLMYYTCEPEQDSFE